MKRPWWKRIGYTAIRLFFWVSAIIFFRFGWRGKENLPGEGGALICSNHQSFFDPILIGICFREQLNYLGRKTLFESPLFGALIRYLDAIPIDRDGMSLSGIKETLRRLKRGEKVVLFPEGTRTEDGSVRELKPGFISLARRGRVPILPAAVDGAYDAWPRGNKLPRPTKLCTVFGPVISVEEIRDMSDDELLQAVHARIMSCHQEARAARGLPPSTPTGRNHNVA